MFRILCIGGSTTEERDFVKRCYPLTLRDRFDADFGKGVVDVVNCGTTGGNTIAHLLRLADYMSLAPDLVILYIGVNDTNIMFSVPNPVPYGALRRATAHSAFIRFWLGSSLCPPDDCMRAIQRRTTLANLDALIRGFQQYSTGVVLCSFAYPDPLQMKLKERLYFSIDAEVQWNAKSLEEYIRAIQLLNEGYRDICAEKGVLYAPIAEAINGVPGYFLDMCHMNDRGSQKKADAIYRQIKAYVALRLKQ